MKIDVYNKIITYLKKIHEELNELIDETYNHRDVTIQKLNKSVDEKTSIIMDLAVDNPNIRPMRFKHSISLIEDV